MLALQLLSQSTNIRAGIFYPSGGLLGPDCGQQIVIGPPSWLASVLVQPKR